MTLNDVGARSCAARESSISRRYGRALYTGTITDTVRVLFIIWSLYDRTDVRR